MAARRIVLASASPRRHEILARTGLEFTVVTSGVDETVASYESPADYSLQLAHRKAEAVARSEPDALVIGGDTIVELDGRIFGKPRDEQDAASMLRDLRGRTHRVTTGVVVIDAATGDSRGRATTTAVTMRNFGDDELGAYVASGEPFDAAGSYAIQGAGGSLVEGIDGPLDNVVGLPANVVTDLLREIADASSLPPAASPALTPGQE